MMNRILDVRRRFAALCAAAFVLAAAASPSLAQAPSAAFAPTVIDDPSVAQRYAETITADELAAHLYVFASDYFEGREATARGQKLAAKYLASQYRLTGLTPMGTVQTDDERDLKRYLQPFTVYGNDLEAADLEVIVNGESVARTEFGLGRHNGSSYLMFGTIPDVRAEVVFAGYGISDGAYDDFAALSEAGISSAGKWLLVLGGEPTDAEGNSLLSDDGELTTWSENLWSKFRAASTSGQVLGILIVDDLGPQQQDLAETARRQAEALEVQVGSISLSEDGPRRAFPPVHAISSEVANAILQPTGRRIDDIKSEIDASFSPSVFAVPNVEVSSTIRNKSVPLVTENVIAAVEGVDPALKHEFIVLTAHYDHVGVDPTLDGDQIFNGADDDGSGTVTLLEIAQAFQKAREDGYGPRRSVLFLTVSAEEKGLLGSRYYSDFEPVVPLENTVANLNIDMIGRHDPTYPGETTDYVYIIGGNLISDDIHEVNDNVNDLLATGIELSDRFNAPDDPNQFYRRSDHWNFAKHNIPFIFYFTGTHEDYHGVGDEPHKVDYERMEKIARLIFGTTWQLANQDERPQVSGPGFN